MRYLKRGKMTTEYRLEEIKNHRESINKGRSYNNELLILAVEELIKINKHFDRVEYDKNHQGG